MEKEILSVQDVAKALGVSTRTVWRAVAENRFPKPYKTCLGGIHKRVLSRWRRETVQPFIDAANGKS